MPFDHELKIRRAFKHLEDLNTEIVGWNQGNHYTVRYEYDPNARWDGPIPPGNPDPDTSTFYLEGSIFIPGQGPGTAPDGVLFGQGRSIAYVTSENPPNDRIGVLIGDVLHNLRSALDNLAYSLSASYTDPLPEEVANSSEFPIFGDEDRSGTLGIGSASFHQRQKSGVPAHGSGLYKVRGWHPDAQTIVEGLQPYHRGNSFREDPLWLLHDLDRIDKHRLLHTVLAGFIGTLWNIQNFRNVRCIGPGLIRSFAGAIDADTPISQIYGVHPIDSDADMHMEIHPAVDIVLAPNTPSAGGAPLMGLLNVLYMHVGNVVVPALTPFL